MIRRRGLSTLLGPTSCRSPSITLASSGVRGGATAVNNDLVRKYSTTGSNFTAMGIEFNFSSPFFDTGAAGGALDGNAATNRVTGITWATMFRSRGHQRGVFYLRWADADNTSTDHALGIDDVNVSRSPSSRAVTVVSHFWVW